MKEYSTLFKAPESEVHQGEWSYSSVMGYSQYILSPTDRAIEQLFAEKDKMSPED